jgi:mRNA-degrading endonuclease RelE of RelBE toxin-antitoxin system
MERIEEEVKQLSKEEQESLRDWLENMLEDNLEFTDEFKARIARGEQDFRAGRVSIRRPCFDHTH